MNAIANNTANNTAATATRGRKPLTNVADVCANVVKNTKAYSYVADLVRLVRAELSNQNLSASDATVRKYVMLALTNAVAKVVAKEKTDADKKVATVVNLQTPNIVRSGVTNINKVAEAIQAKLQSMQINRSVWQIKQLLVKKEKAIACAIANNIVNKNGKLPTPLGLTRNKPGRPKNK
jgi:hypothetical protein